MDRRKFLKSVGLVSSALAINPDVSFAAGENRNAGLSILQGPTNESTTQIAIDLPDDVKARYEATDIATGSKLPVKDLGVFTFGSNSGQVQHIRIDNLELGHRYQLKVYSEENEVLDQREFGPLDTKASKVNIALISCMNDMFGKNIDQSWKIVKDSKPDMVFLLGDNCYGDIGGVLYGPNMLWKRYLTTRQNLALYHWPYLIPSFAIWDDHDFGKDNAGGDYEYAKESFEVFNAFYAQEAIEGFYRKGQGTASSVDLFGYRFVLLDDRLWRNLPSKVGNGMLGDQQFEWMMNEIKSTDLNICLLLGSQFFGGYQKGENYETLAPEEFEQFKQQVGALNKPIIMVSGDVHYSEIMKLDRQNFGLDGIEITSSGLHSFANDKLPTNPRRVAGGLGNNFIKLDIENGQATKATCIGIDKVNFAYQIKF